MSKKWDLVIVGGGIVGCALAWYLSHFDLAVLLLEKELEVGTGVSKANTGIVHSRSYWTPGTLKGELHLRSLPWWERAKTELELELLETGALTVAFSQEELSYLRLLRERRGTEEADIITGLEAKELEPEISPQAYAAFYDPTARVVSPFQLTLALAEGAYLNGVQFEFGQQVVGFESTKEAIRIFTPDREYRSAFAVTCGGLASSQLVQIGGDSFPAISPFRGEYYVLDRELEGWISHVLYPVPTGETKGILLSPTPEGNILVGPNFEPAQDEDTATTYSGLAEVGQGGRKLAPRLPLDKTISYFSGLRPTLPDRDFQLFFSPSSSRLFHVCGIESPGLSACFGIAEYVGDLLQRKGLPLSEKKNFVFRRSFPVFRKLTWESRDRLIEDDPDWGQVICRCEEVTLAEVKHALTTFPLVKTLDGLKRKVRPMAGRCQGSFCGMNLPSVIEEVLGWEGTKIVKSNRNSYWLAGETKVSRKIC